MVVTLQDRVRDLLFDATGHIPNEAVAGVVFAAGLIVTDHIFNLSEVTQWLRI